jgi:hypothetical protein
MSTPISLPDLLRVRRESLERKLKVLESTGLSVWMDSPIRLRKIVELLLEAEEYTRPIVEREKESERVTTDIKPDDPDWYVEQDESRSDPCSI